jgi:hypothetical protein
MLEKEFQFFLDHQAELVAKYSGKFLVIRGTEVIGAYDSDEEAYFQTLKKFEPGTFLIQFCEDGDASYTQTFHSRVAFVK